MHTEFCSENYKGRDHLEDFDIDGREILNWTLKRIRSDGVK
jgi:hypothetical protein